MEMESTDGINEWMEKNGIKLVNRFVSLTINSLSY